MRPALRIGVAGLGTMGRHHVRLCQAVDDLELAAVFDIDSARASVVAGVPFAGTVGELAALVDAAIVAVPTSDHKSICLELIEAGVHVLVEKPLADTSESAREIVDAATARGVTLAVGHVERFSPAIRELHERLGRGELGEVFHIATSRQGPFPDRIRDVGVVKDLATHDIDLTQFISGQRYAEVTARTAHLAGRAHEDLLSCVGVMTNGLIVNHMVNWLSPTKEREVVVVGQRGRFRADLLSADLWFAANASVKTEWDHVANFRGVSEGDLIRYAFPKPEPLRVQLEHFRDAIATGAGGTVTGTDGLEVVVVAEAMIRSAQTGIGQVVGHPA